MKKEKSEVKAKQKMGHFERFAPMHGLKLEKIMDEEVCEKDEYTGEENCYNFRLFRVRGHM